MEGQPRHQEDGSDKIHKTEEGAEPKDDVHWDLLHGYTEHPRSKRKSEKEASKPSAEQRPVPDTRNKIKERSSAETGSVSAGKQDRVEYGNEAQNNAFKEEIKQALRGTQESKGGDIDTKKDVKQKLRDVKHKIQKEDYEQVKKLREKSDTRPQYQHGPWRENRYWNEAKKSYRAAWEELRTWARGKDKPDTKDENRVWKEADEIEYLKESGTKARKACFETLRPKSHIAETVLGGGGSLAVRGFWFMLMLPGVAFDRALGAILPYFVDLPKTKKDSRKEKKSAEEKKVPDSQKEFETKGKVKDAHIAYLRYIRKNITEEKLRESRTAKEYEELTFEQREPLENNALKELGNTKEVSAYKKAWIDMRKYWIAEEVWKSANEKEFRVVVGFDKDNKKHLEGYMLTLSEYRELEDLRAKLRKKGKSPTDIDIDVLKKEIKDLTQKIEKIKDDTTQQAKLKELTKEKNDKETVYTDIRERQRINENIEEIEKKAENRGEDYVTTWPPFKKGDEKKGKKGDRASQEQENLGNEGDADEDEEEE